MKLFTGIDVLPSFKMTKAVQNVMSPFSWRMALGFKIPVTAFSVYSKELVLIRTLSFGGIVISVGLRVGSNTFEYLWSAVLSCIEKNGKFSILCLMSSIV